MQLEGTVLVCDGNKGLITALVHLINKKFSNVITESNYDKIIHIAKNQSLDIIVIDAGKNSWDEQEKLLNFIREIVDLNLNIQIVTLTNFSQNSFAMQTIECGAFDFASKPWNNEKLTVTLENAYKMRQCMSAIKQIEALKESLKSENHFFWGISRSSSGLFEEAQKLSRSDNPVLLCGEKGTGKELLAQQIHDSSKRGNYMFLKTSAKDLTTDELEEKLAMAHGGTLYIENIEVLNADKQKLLLTIIKNKIINNLNNNTSINANVRIIAGSYCSCTELASTGQINDELYNSFKKSYLNIPPLNDRKEDIIPLATIFLNKYSKKYNKQINGFTNLSKEILTSYNWVGNTSELSLAIERAVILTPNGNAIHPGYLMLNTTSENIPEESISTLTLEQMEKKMIAAALKRNNGNITLAAEQLGITRQTLYNKGKKYKLFK